MEDKIEFTVTGKQRIHRSGCEQQIGRALRRLPGIQKAWASALTQRVAVTIDPTQVSPDEVRAKLGQLGYQVAPKGSAA